MVLNLSAGEYRLYTDVQLEVPDIGTSTADIINIASSSVSVFPNPVSTNATLLIHLEEISDLMIGVYNVLGEKVMDLGERTFPQGKQQLEINMDALESGLYFINIRSDSISDTIKVVKQ
jgi:hypothetical protein